jgi:hypothetical protein
MASSRAPQSGRRRESAGEGAELEAPRKPALLMAVIDRGTLLSRIGASELRLESTAIAI